MVAVLAERSIQAVGVGAGLVGVAVAVSERRPYEAAIKSGAQAARGWFPLLLLWGAVLVAILVAAALLPTSEIR